MAKKQHYEILGVSKNASKEDIKKAYRSLAKKYHPDVSKTEDTDLKFKKIREAYEILGDPHKKRNKNVKYCSYCGEVIENTDPNEKKPESSRNIVFSVIIVLQIISILVLAYFYVGSFNNKAETQLEELLQQIESLQGQVRSLKFQTESFSEIASFINEPDAGRASSNFYASEKVVILSKSAKQKAFSVTAELPRPYTLEWDYDGSVVEISSAKSWKDIELTIYVRPVNEGSSFITFTNTRNSQKFRVLVIVVE